VWRFGYWQVLSFFLTSLLTLHTQLFSFFFKVFVVAESILQEVPLADSAFRLSQIRPDARSGTQNLLAQYKLFFVGKAFV
jgi:hypothetical protein